jgi:hypothetical protein
MTGHCKVRDVVLRLLEYILETGRWALRMHHAEGQPVCLARAVIRVLTDHHDADVVEGTRAEGAEDQVSGRVDLLRGGLLREEEIQAGEVGLREFPAENGDP